MNPKPPKLPSERNFGLFFGALLFLIGTWRFIFHHSFSHGLFGFAIGLGTIALTIPILLRPLNLGWFTLGKLLHKVTNPLIMGVIFFGVLTPLGRFRQWFGKETIPKNYNPHINTYWVNRVPPGPSSQSLSDQF